QSNAFPGSARGRLLRQRAHEPGVRPHAGDPPAGAPADRAVQPSQLIQDDAAARSHARVMKNDSRAGGLLAWQFAGYSQNHGARRNLLIHALTVPLFQLGTLAALASPVAWWLGVGGALTMVISIALQGRGHRLEPTPPAAFRGPVDIIARLL